MPYKVFIAGEEALAADVNSYLMSQTIARFPTAAARTSAIASPTLNQLSMLDNRLGVVQYWTGSAWADISPFVQAGQNNVTTDAAGLATVTFPSPFTGPSPIVTCNILGPSSTTAPFVAMIIASPLSTAFAAKIWNGGAAYVGLPINLSWIAVGLRP